MPSKSASKKPAAAAAKGKGKKIEKERNPLFISRPRTFGIGGRLPPKRDLTRFVRWPKYIKIQRQRRVLYGRMKVPGQINQFEKTLDKSSVTNLFKLLAKYRPLTKYGKNKKLRELAAKKEKGETVKSEKKNVIKCGLNHVTHLVEQKKAKLVIIAHDVDPIELVVWLPTLCKKMDVPYCIVKSKARLGKVVHKKTATCLAITDVDKKDAADLAQMVTICRDLFNDNPDVRRGFGGGKFGVKSMAAQRAKARAVAKEEKARAGAL